MGGLTLGDLVSALSDALPEGGKEDDVLDAVCHLLNVEKRELSGSKESLRLSVARALTVQGLSTIVRMDYKAIADVLQRPYETVAVLHAELSDFVLLNDQCVEYAKPMILTDKDKFERLKTMCTGMPANKIIATIAESYGLIYQDLVNATSRRRHIVAPRQVAMYFLRMCTPYSLVDIGRLFLAHGKPLTHTTVRLSIQKVEAMMKEEEVPKLVTEERDPPERIVVAEGIGYIVPSSPKEGVDLGAGAVRAYHSMEYYKIVRRMISDPTTRFATVVDTFVRIAGLEKNDVVGEKRGAAHSSARFAIAIILRERFKCSYQDIGELLGGRDHSTIIYALDEIERVGLYNPSKEKVVRSDGSDNS